MAKLQKTNLFIDPVLWGELRVRAIREHVTATELLNRAIAEFLGRAREAEEQPAARKTRKGRA